MIIKHKAAWSFLKSELASRKGQPFADLAIIDPPYSSLDADRSVGTTTRLQTFFPTVSNEYIIEICKLIYNCLHDNSHFYMFCDQRTAFEIVPEIQKTGFKFWKPIVWDKVAIGMGYHYRCRYEFILFFEKGKRKLNSNSMPDILECKRIPHTQRIYPTEKPVGLIEMLIKQSSAENEVVLDCFLGSGSTAVAAINLNRDFIGCDSSKQSIEITQGRVASAVVRRDL